MLLIDVVNESYSMLFVNVGAALLLGMILGRVAERFRLPNVTGYLIAGLILGPISGFLTTEELQHLEFIGDLALGFIAFQVGNELWIGKLKETGRKIVIITIIQALFTSAVVILVLIWFTEPGIALMLGAIAAATAPAPIMMLISKYKTKGELTDTIVPIVGLDDAVGVILFGILLSISIVISGAGTTNADPIQYLLQPLIEIGESLLIGGGIGLLAGFAMRTMTQYGESKISILDTIVITVFITVGLALVLDASPILTPMIAGAVVTNLINKDTYKLEESTIRFFVPPLMILFFTLSGARLEFSVLQTAGLLGLLYIVGRTIGKFGGCWIGTSVVKSSPHIRSYLGFAMLPQSGVAIGLAMAAYNALKDSVPDQADTIHNITLLSVFVFALIGPILVKMAFDRTGETKKSATE